ncbi:MAG: hypothetical protein LQ338_007915 [Usnochroma carphineum]|nr:MAG: hypothetical protein LQ338_007915 [Usnochroma carphineum]
MEPSSYDQLQGKRNARAWKRQFKVAALGKGVWDVFTGIYTAVACPDAKDYGLENAQADATAPATQLSEDEKNDKGKRKARTTLGPEEIGDFIKNAAASAAEQKKGLDFNSRMTLYKFTLDEYDKGRKIVATAMALLINWVHASLRGQLEAFVDPKEAYDHLVARYSVTDARAREMAENQFNNIYISRFGSAQNYINAIENAAQDIKEAGGYCDSPMLISKIIRGLRGHPTFKDFATQYHLLRDIDTKFEDLDHVITQLLTFESTNQQEPDFRNSAGSGNRYDNAQGLDFRNPTGNGNRFVNRNNLVARDSRVPRDQCTACGIWGHNEANCRKTHPEQRPQNNGYTSRPVNVTYRNNNAPSGNSYKRGTKPNGMAASALVNDKEFTKTLRRAQAASMDSLPALLEGTPPPTLMTRTLAKDCPQNETGWIGSKGEQSKGETEYLGVQELFREDHDQWPFTVLTEASSHSTSRNNTSVSTMEDDHNYELIPNANGTDGNASTDPSDWQTEMQLEWEAAMQEEHEALIRSWSYFTQPPEKFHTINNPKAPPKWAFHKKGTPPKWIIRPTMNPRPEVSQQHADGAVCLSTSDMPVDPNAWILDSGANVYICNDASWFTTLHEFDMTVSTAGQGSDMRISGGGVVKLQLKDGDGDVFTLTKRTLRNAKRTLL